MTLASIKAPTLTDLGCLAYSDCVKLIDKIIMNLPPVLIMQC